MSRLESSKFTYQPQYYCFLYSFQGHEINIRDYAGWLPIHDACNHGHVEIATYLAEKGALINDRGGIECEGITPLHEAVNNGHFCLVRVLVEQFGAAVHAKDSKVSYIFKLHTYFWLI